MTDDKVRKFKRSIFIKKQPSMISKSLDFFQRYDQKIDEYFNAS